MLELSSSCSALARSGNKSAPVHFDLILVGILCIARTRKSISLAVFYFDDTGSKIVHNRKLAVGPFCIFNFDEVVADSIVANFRVSSKSVPFY